MSFIFLTLKLFEIKTEAFQSFTRSSSIHFLLENISEALPCQEGRLKIKKLKKGRTLRNKKKEDKQGRTPETTSKWSVSRKMN